MLKVSYPQKKKKAKKTINFKILKHKIEKNKVRLVKRTINFLTNKGKHTFQCNLKERSKELNN